MIGTKFKESKEEKKKEKKKVISMTNHYIIVTTVQLEKRNHNDSIDMVEEIFVIAQRHCINHQKVVDAFYFYT